MRTPRSIALIYAALSSLSVMLLATMMPPMQNGDEAAHSYRAEQVSRLGFVRAVIPDGDLGGRVSAGMVRLQEKTDVLKFNVDAKISRAMLAPLPWGPLIWMGFPNTAIDPPFFYAGSATVVAIARALKLPLPHALVLMRLGTGALAVAISTLAIAIAGSAAIWLYAILLLPMSLALTAGVGEDGTMLASTALAAALTIRLRRARATRRVVVVGLLVALLSTVAMGRSPYLAFALVLFALPIPPLCRAAAFLVTACGTVGWMAISLVNFPPRTIPGQIVSPHRQLAGLVTHPGRWVGLAVHTVAVNGDLVAQSFIGRLGWLDVALPTHYRDAAWVMVGVAALAAIARGSGPIPKMLLLAGTVGIGGAVCGVALAQYLTWTPVGWPYIEGLQGRYLLPPAAMAAVLMGRTAIKDGRASRLLERLVLTFPLFSIVATVHAIIIRYYL